MERSHYDSAGSPSDHAIEWLARLRADDVTPRETADFAAWLAASSLNKVAFDEATELWGKLRRLPAQPAPHRVAPRRYRRSLPLAAAASLLIACVMMVMQLTTTGFSTGKGELRRIVLDDGTTAFLNTASDISVDYSARARRIELHGGEVWFDVTPDTERPFTVVGRYATVEAVGTAFTVRETPGFTSIGVTEGVVAVHGAREKPHLLEPGQQSTVSSTVTDFQTYDEATALAWRRGELVYNNVRLDDVLADLNRYLPKTMTVNDAVLPSKRINIVLHLDYSQDAMLEALGKALPIRWKAVSDSLIIITSAG